MITHIKDPKPEIMRLEELALLVKAGEIKLPRFQRPFVWKSPDMLKLLDSIYKGYPIGSILIWNSSQKLISERSILGLEVNSEDNSFYPTNYLLDGQQRLTTLCGALFWNGEDKNSIWNICFDIEKEEFLYPKEDNLITLFPLNKLIKTSDFIKQCMKFDHHDKRDDYYKIAERLLKSIKDYKIAVVKIGDMTIDEVAPIFERINSTGRKLTIVDLMMAATWSEGFDLTNRINNIKEHCEEIGFMDITDPIILRSIAASAGLGINKDDIQKLRTKNSNDLCCAAEQADRSLQEALSFLRDRIRILDLSYLPYGIQLTYLAEFYRLCDCPTKENIQHLIQWFWFTSVTRYFTSANTGQIAKDLLAVRSYATGEIDKLFEKREIDITQLLFDRFILKNATSTTFALLLNSMAPDITLDNKHINGSHLSIKSGKFFVSYSPKNGQIEKQNIAKVIYPYASDVQGFCLMVTAGNLKKHLIDENCVEAKERNDVALFISHRAAIIAEKVSELTSCGTTYNVPNGQLVSNESDDSEI